MEKIKTKLREEAVLIISFIAVLITSFYVPPSIDYLTYIDFGVLVLLFCLMIIIAGLKDIGLFNLMAKKIAEGSKNTKGLFLNLVLICFISSMLITNDVALITFVPFSILVLNYIGQNKNLIYVVIMQTVAANLGSMLTPVGNPQNLYLYSFYNLGTIEFFKITIPITFISLLLVIALSLIGKHEQIYVKFNINEKINKNKLLIYLVLFAISLATVFRILDYKITFIIVFLTILSAERKLFKHVDYSLIVTFVCFFIFTGNIKNIETIRNIIVSIIKGNELIYSIIFSQVLSNVPTAVLLSNFTENYKSLIIGTNIGGLGTIVASLASLISYKLYVQTENSKPGKYLFYFSIVNLLVLFILYMFSINIL